MDGEFLQKYRQRRDRRESYEKGKGDIWVFMCGTTWASDRRTSRDAHTHYFRKWKHSSLRPLWQSMDNTKLGYITSKPLKSLAAAALLQLFKSTVPTTLSPPSHASHQLSPSFTWLLKITFKITESLNRLFKLYKAYRSASLQMPLATRHRGRTRK